jgi:hypothetical protein
VTASRDERLAANQRSFREANERLQELAEVDADRLVPFLCECADMDCLGRVEATLEEFDDAHLGANNYFLLPGHRRIEGEEILSENGRFEIVAKS